MAMSPEDVAALLQREGSGLSPDAYDETPQPDGARQQRTEALAAVLDSCREATQQNSEQLEAMAKNLGDGGRDGELPELPTFSSPCHGVSIFRMSVGCGPSPRHVTA